MPPTQQTEGEPKPKKNTRTEKQKERRKELSRKRGRCATLPEKREEKKASDRKNYEKKCEAQGKPFPKKRQPRKCYVKRRTKEAGQTELVPKKIHLPYGDEQYAMGHENLKLRKARADDAAYIDHLRKERMTDSTDLLQFLTELDSMNYEDKDAKIKKMLQCNHENKHAMDDTYWAEHKEKFLKTLRPSKAGNTRKVRKKTLDDATAAASAASSSDLARAAAEPPTSAASSSGIARDSDRNPI